MKYSGLLLLYIISILVHSRAYTQANEDSSTLEKGEFLEKTTDGYWTYKTLVNNEPFSFLFPADFQPYNSYLKESMPALLIYNNPEFNKVRFDEGDWMLTDSTFIIIKFYDINQGELDYISEDFEDRMDGFTIDDIYVGSFVDDAQIAGMGVQSYYLTLEDIYYWRIDFAGQNSAAVKKFGLDFIKNFILLNKNR